MDELFMLEQCASARSYEAKLKGKKINLENAENALKGNCEIIAKTPAMLVVLIEDIAATIYPNCIMLKNVDRTKAMRSSKKIIELLERGGAIS